MIDPGWLKTQADSIRAADWIDSACYKKYNVKRGLRNEDGTGVLVGLTSIGSVHGYMVSESEKVSVPGQLFYRGVQIFGTTPHQQFQVLLVLPYLGSHQPDQRREKHKTKQADDHGLLPVIFHNAGKLVLLKTEADIPHQIAGIVL